MWEAKGVAKINVYGSDFSIWKGDIGFQDHTVFTALGDPVNVAARLQDMTKVLDCKAVISDEVFTTAGIATASLARREVAIRGREEAMIVLAVTDPTVLASLVEAPTPQAPVS